MRAGSELRTREERTIGDCRMERCWSGSAQKPSKESEVWAEVEEPDESEGREIYLFKAYGDPRVSALFPQASGIVQVCVISNFVRPLLGNTSDFRYWLWCVVVYVIASTAYYGTRRMDRRGLWRRITEKSGSALGIHATASSLPGSSPARFHQTPTSLTSPLPSNPVLTPSSTSCQCWVEKLWVGKCRMERRRMGKCGIGRSWAA